MVVMTMMMMTMSMMPEAAASAIPALEASANRTPSPKAEETIDEMSVQVMMMKIH